MGPTRKQHQSQESHTLTDSACSEQPAQPLKSQSPRSQDGLRAPDPQLPAHPVHPVHPAHRLVEWYKRNRRALPWRDTKDPYRILVSETMLQQTRVETVIPYYHTFLEQFPDIAALAAAPVDDVLKAWQGLGYYSRARNLKKAAEAVMAQYQGIMPDTVESLLSLPGIGPYTAGAVASIAFDQHAPAVDGNVLRVIARFYGISDPVDIPATKRTVTDIVSRWGLEEQPSLFTQSVMELGAMICTPRSPNCSVCPLQDDCAAFQSGLTEELPRKTPKKPRKIIQVVAFWLENERGILLEKRKDAGLLAGMWQLPAIEAATPLSLADAELDLQFRKLVNFSGGTAKKAGQVLGKPLVPQRPHGPQRSQESQWLQKPQKSESGPSESEEENLRSFVLVGEEKHIFTHIEWRVQVYRPVGIDVSAVTIPKGFEMVFVPRSEMRQYVLPRVYEKIIGSMLGERVR